MKTTKVRMIGMLGVVILGLSAIIGSGDDGITIETSEVDCDVSKANVTSDVVGNASAGGSTISGKITFTCDGSPLPGVKLLGNNRGWVTTPELGPSDSAGVISVNRNADALKVDDVGKKKRVVIRLKGVDASGQKATREFPFDVESK